MVLTKIIKISENLKNYLDKQGRKNETYDEIIQRLIFKSQKKSKMAI